MDQDWIKILAHSSFQNSHWTLVQSDLNNLKSHKLNACMERLFEIAEQQLREYNAYAQNVLNLFGQNGETENLQGFLIVLNHTQIDAHYSNQKLKCMMKRVHGFETKTELLEEYELIQDFFGSLYWRSSRGVTYSEYDLVKKLVIDLVKAQ